MNMGLFQGLVPVGTRWPLSSCSLTNFSSANNFSDDMGHDQPRWAGLMSKLILGCCAHQQPMLKICFQPYSLLCRIIQNHKWLGSVKASVRAVKTDRLQKLAQWPSVPDKVSNDGTLVAHGIWKSASHWLQCRWVPWRLWFFLCGSRHRWSLGIHDWSS